jgi:hypothetical protein
MNGRACFRTGGGATRSPRQCGRRVWSGTRSSWPAKAACPAGWHGAPAVPSAASRRGRARGGGVRAGAHERSGGAIGFSSFGVLLDYPVVNVAARLAACCRWPHWLAIGGRRHRRVRARHRLPRVAVDRCMPSPGLVPSAPSQFGENTASTKPGAVPEVVVVKPQPAEVNSPHRR